MKLTSFFLVCLFGLSTSVNAANRHAHSVMPSNNVPASAALKWAGPCEIEIVNYSFSNVRVFGVFDDGVPLQPFNVYRFDAPHYIDLFYNGYCFSGMDLDIDTFDGQHVFGGYVRRGTTVNISPYAVNQAKVELSHS